MKLTPLEAMLYNTCKDALANLQGLDVPGQFEVDINRRPRRSIKAAEAKKRLPEEAPRHVEVRKQNQH